MPTLIVTNSPKDWPATMEGAEVIDAGTYLTDASYHELRGAKVFNLCRSYRYQSNGYYESLLATARGHRPIAYDLRPKNCRIAQLRARRYRFPLPALSGQAERLPFTDGSFDLVCLLEVLEHVDDPAAVLAEARRVCRPGGACVVTVVNRWAHLDPHYRLWGVNFLPRRWAERYIDLRGRAKKSIGDQQALADMHYFSYPAFGRFALAHGFEIDDSRAPSSRLRGYLQRLARRLSLGFNTATVVLRPV